MGGGRVGAGGGPARQGAGWLGGWGKGGVGLAGAGALHSYSFGRAGKPVQRTAGPVRERGGAESEMEGGGARAREGGTPVCASNS